MSIEKEATRIAAEMVHVYSEKGLPLDADYIAKESCKIVYAIHEDAKRYKKRHKMSDYDLGK